MGTRQQTTGGLRSGVRPAYEDFSPNSEWKHQEQSHILTVYLPGFVKEQIKVSTEGTNIIRISGEKLVEGNKWSRFKEDFDIPQDCNIRAINARLEAKTGTLTITMPKKAQLDPIPKPKAEEEAKTTTLEAPSRPPGDTTDKPRYDKVQEDPKEDKPKHEKVQDDLKADKPRYEKAQEEPKAHLMGDEKKRPIVDDKISTTTLQSPRPQEATARLPPPQPGLAQDAYIDTPRPKMITNSEHEYGNKGLKETTPQKAIAAAAADLKATSAAKRIVQEEAINARKERSEAEWRPKVSEITMEKPIITQKKEKESSDQKGLEHAVIKKEKEDGTKGGAKGKQTTDVTSSGGRDGGGVLKVEKYKQAVKRVAGALSLREERQLILNMGTALLVIVALGAYIYTTLKGSTENARN